MPAPCGPFKAETDEEKAERLNEYWAAQKENVKQLKPLDETLGNALAYVKEKAGSDPMLDENSPEAAKFAAKASGGGCTVQ